MIRIGDVENIRYVVRSKAKKSLFLFESGRYNTIDKAHFYQSAVAWDDAKDYNGEVLILIGGMLYDLVEVQ
jgi:hypothetical protein